MSVYDNIGRAPYDVVRCPAGVVKDQPDTYGVRPILHEFSSAMINTFLSKFLQKTQIVKKSKFEAALIMMEIKTTLAQECKDCTCCLHVNHPHLLNRNIYIYIYVFGLQK